MRFSALLSAAVFVTAACGSEAELTVTVMDDAACADYCVDQLVVTALGRTSTVACGEGLALGPVETGRAIELKIRTVGRGASLAFDGSVEAKTGEDILQDVVLTASSSPVVASVTPQRTPLIGGTPILVTGSGLGDGSGDSFIRADGELVEIRSWTDSSILFLHDQPAEIVVRACGVDVPARSFEAETVQHTTVPVDFADCGAPRLIGADVAMGGGGAWLGAFRCGTACLTTKVARLDASGNVERDFETIAGCTEDLAIQSPGTAYLVMSAAETEGARITRVESQPDDTLNVSAFHAGFNFVRVGIAPNEGFATLLGVAWIPWTSTFLGRPVKPFEDRISLADDANRDLILGTDASGNSLLAQVTADSIVRTIDVRCPSPARIARGFESSGRLTVVCDARVDVYDLASGDRLGGLMLPEAIGEIQEAAVTQDGRIVVVYTDNGVLAYADAEAGWTSHENRPIRPERAELLRVSGQDRFFLTGAVSGTIDVIDIPARTD